MNTLEINRHTAVISFAPGIEYFVTSLEFPTSQEWGIAF
ncbi:hypothetical protein BDD26_2083 [Xenorhabdus cabanillasii]|uniref:Uncharacterized protein n=1 Tax=Xenorhabdus cabanillasii TaxID=351673 RepID=A0A3D9UDG6_9GAMM|nr:hypothetical protein Xcab_03791 [Xenorhabdus cabanillasii JM26]REF27316.1 hypothetical protein BDD26_2083 [Xenorhabdus cabanillasii]